MKKNVIHWIIGYVSGICIGISIAFILPRQKIEIVNEPVKQVNHGVYIGDYINKHCRNYKLIISGTNDDIHYMLLDTVILRENQILIYEPSYYIHHNASGHVGSLKTNTNK